MSLISTIIIKKTKIDESEKTKGFNIKIKNKKTQYTKHWNIIRAKKMLMIFFREIFDNIF